VLRNFLLWMVCTLIEIAHECVSFFALVLVLTNIFVWGGIAAGAFQ
jgi:hypothetical protein